MFDKGSELCPRGATYYEQTIAKNGIPSQSPLYTRMPTYFNAGQGPKDPLEFVYKQPLPIKFSILARQFQYVLSCIDCGPSVVNMLCHSGNGALYAL